MNGWDIARIKGYITEQVEENLALEYKAADSLQRIDGKKREITKDVSALANSAGGILIYGIREYPDEARKHMPERLDPVDRTTFSKETLEQVINNIRPRIDGLVIHPVAVEGNPTGVVYVVDIPQGHTAHQALDKRYYKRFNFESVPMEDYELRDVLFRARQPALTITLYGKSQQTDLGNRVYGKLFFALKNSSSVSAKNVVISISLGSPTPMNRIDIPQELLAGTSFYRDPIHEHRKIRTSKRDIVHKGLMTTAVELEYELYTTIAGMRMASHDIEFGLFADDMEPGHFTYRIALSPDNVVSVERIEKPDEPLP